VDEYEGKTLEQALGEFREGKRRGVIYARKWSGKSATAFTPAGAALRSARTEGRPPLTKERGRV
jgi:hypothetical protein